MLGTTVLKKKCIGVTTVCIVPNEKSDNHYWGGWNFTRSANYCRLRKI